MAIEMRDRVLVWGFSNNRAGTEHVIHGIASKLPEIPFDFLCYSAPEGFSTISFACPTVFNAAEGKPL